MKQNKTSLSLLFSIVIVLKLTYVVLFQIYCQVLHVVIQYLMVANYFWMFCEGLHLHLALVVVFVKDNWAMRWFYFLGWGVPALITTLYTVVRYNTPEDTYQ